MILSWIFPFCSHLLWFDFLISPITIGLLYIFNNLYIHLLSYSSTLLVINILPISYAFQLLIRDRFTQFTLLSHLLEPLDFRPSCFSQPFSLLISTFSLLIAFLLPSYRLIFLLYRTLYYLNDTMCSFLFPILHLITYMSVAITANVCFIFISFTTASVLHSSLPYFRRMISSLVRFYTFIIGWLLPSLPSNCHRDHTSLCTSCFFETLSFRLGCFPLNL